MYFLEEKSKKLTSVLAGKEHASVLIMGYLVGYDKNHQASPKISVERSHQNRA